MAFYTNGIQNIDNQGIVELPIVQSPNLPISAVAGYLLYLQDQKVLTVSTGNPSDLWRSFQAVPLSYKNEVPLEQSIIAGGYNSDIGFDGRNSMSRLQFSSDATIQLSTTVPFNLARGAHHSTWQYAYFHGGNVNSSAKQDWSTFTITSITSRPGSNFFPTACLNPGKKGENTLGLLFNLFASYEINFSTDSWSTGNYNNNTNNNCGTFGETSGYAWNQNTVQKLNWSTRVWSATGAGPANGSNFSKLLNSKWNKWYLPGNTGGVGGTGGTPTMDIYSNSSDTFSAGATPVTTILGCDGVMAQDWGYWAGYYNFQEGYTGNALKMDYASNTMSSSLRSYLAYSVSNASTPSGPIS